VASRRVMTLAVSLKLHLELSNLAYRTANYNNRTIVQTCELVNLAEYAPSYVCETSLSLR
jgi:hypothetical protein